MAEDGQREPGSGGTAHRGPPERDRHGGTLAERVRRATVRPRQTRMSTRPLALSHSELTAQHKDLGVLPPPLPPPMESPLILIDMG
jgi:hypothetical protein